MQSTLIEQEQLLTTCGVCNVAKPSEDFAMDRYTQRLRSICNRCYSTSTAGPKAPNKIQPAQDEVLPQQPPPVAIGIQKSRLRKNPYLSPAGRLQCIHCKKYKAPNAQNFRVWSYPDGRQAYKNTCHSCERAYNKGWEPFKGLPVAQQHEVPVTPGRLVPAAQPTAPNNEQYETLRATIDQQSRHITILEEKLRRAAAMLKSVAQSSNDGAKGQRDIRSMKGLLHAVVAEVENLLE